MKCPESSVHLEGTLEAVCSPAEKLCSSIEMPLQSKIRETSLGPFLGSLSLSQSGHNSTAHQGQKSLGQIQ